MKDLPVPLKMVAFADLVRLQDRGQDVTSSRLAIALKYGIGVEDVKLVERAGLDAEWPPL